MQSSRRGWMIVIRLQQTTQTTLGQMDHHSFQYDDEETCSWLLLGGSCLRASICLYVNDAPVHRRGTGRDRSQRLVVRDANGRLASARQTGGGEQG